MSRHHMLPPIVYTPQPKPKKIESRKSRVQVRSAGAAGKAVDVDETGETIGFEQPVVPAGPPASQNFAPIEGSEHKPGSTTGRLSEGTLKTLLVAQEEVN